MSPPKASWAISFIRFSSFCNFLLILGIIRSAGVIMAHHSGEGGHWSVDQGVQCIVLWDLAHCKGFESLPGNWYLLVAVGKRLICISPSVLQMMKV